MEEIDELLFNLDFNNINKAIDLYLKQLYSKYDSLQSYTLLIGSKGDTIQKNKSFIDELNSIMSPISTIYSIIEHSLNYQFVHKNEKVECKYKLKPKVKETNLYIDKLCTLFDDTLRQNKHFVKNVNKLLDKSQNSKELLSIKESINELLLKNKETLKNQMNKAKETYKENSNWNQIYLSTNTTFTSSRNDSVQQIEEKIEQKNCNKLSEKETIVFEVIFTIIILYILFY